MVVTPDADLDLAVEGAAVLRLRHRRAAVHLAGHGDRARVRPRRVPGAVRRARRRQPPIGDPAQRRALRADARPEVRRPFRGVPGLDPAAPHGARLHGHRPDHRRQPAGRLRRRPRGGPVLPPDDRRRRAGRRRAVPAARPSGRIVGVDRPSRRSTRRSRSPTLPATACPPRSTPTPARSFTFRRGIGAGMVSVNNSTSGAEAHLPFGGNGRSGNGSRSRACGCSTSSPAGSR